MEPLLRLPVLFVLFVAIALTTPTPAAQRQLPRLLAEGSLTLLVLPFGSTDVLVSRSGDRAAVAAVTFNRERNAPERLLLAIDLLAPAIAWRHSLPSATCCAFPVLAATPEVDAVALGGAEQTVVYTPGGKAAFAATLNDGRLHSALGISDDGRLIVVGEREGRLAAFERGRQAPLWVREVGQGLMALAVSGNGQVVVAASREEVLLYRARDGLLLSRRAYGPARTAAVAVSRDGSRAGLMWKRQDGRMVLEVIERGRGTWARQLHAGTVPMLQMDARGRWLAAADLLGRQAAVYSWRGEVVWQEAGADRVASAVDAQGLLAAIAVGTVVEVRSLPSGRAVWRSRLPGTAHLVRLGGTRLAVLGAEEQEGLPDRIWFYDIGGPR